MGCGLRGVEGCGDEEGVVVVVVVVDSSVVGVVAGVSAVSLEIAVEEDEGKRRASTLSRKTSSHHELRWPLLKLPRPSMTQRSILP